MSKCLFLFVARVIVTGFFALSAWNTLQNIEEHSKLLSTKYKTFQDRVTHLSGLGFHESIHHDNVSSFAETIVMYICYVTLTLSVLSLIKPSVGKLVAFVWFLTQVLEHEFLELTQNRNLKQLEVLAMTLAVFLSGLIVNSSCKKSLSCGGKNPNSTVQPTRTTPN